MSEYIDNTIKGLYETSEDVDYFVYKICNLKDDLHLTWQNIADIVSQYFDGENHSESYYRKRYRDGIIHSDFEEVDNSAEDFETIESKILKLRKEKVKLSDERVQNNAYIRRLAREDTIKEIAKYYADKMNCTKILPTTHIIDNNGYKEALLMISDWHYGIEINNYYNIYDTDIAKARIRDLLDETISRCDKENISHIHVLNLGDMICGRIHLQLRLESRIDTITQIMEVSEILAEFLNELSQHYKVDYYECSDNHSRIEPNKKDSIDLESLHRITKWYLKNRFYGNENVSVNDNKYSDDIISLNVLGHSIIGVHGHDDAPNTALDKLTLMTQSHHDLLCMAHRHHFAADESNSTLVVCNGSMMGTDSYAEKLRLSSIPSQNLVFITEANVCDSIHRLVL